MSCDPLWSRTQTLSAFRRRQGAGGQGAFERGHAEQVVQGAAEAQDGECAPGQARAGTVRGHADTAFRGRGETA